MKLSSITLVTLAALTMGSQAHAIDLTVKGEITAPACAASMDGGGVLDWGRIAHSELSAIGFKLLEAKEATLKIDCDAEQKVSFAVEFNRSDDTELVGGGSDHNLADRIFGLGIDTATGKKIGNFIVLHRGGSYDGITAERFGWGQRGVGNFTVSGTTLPNNTRATQNTTEEYTLLTGNTTVPALAKNFTYLFDVEPAINKKSEISSTSVVPFAGKALLTIRYL